MENRLLIETYIAYQLCQKNIIVIGEINDGGLLDYISELTGSTNIQSLKRYLRRCLEDLKTIKAISDNAKVRMVIDQSEREFWTHWEDEFYLPENIIYDGKTDKTRKYRNLKISHLSPVDYTFTLGSYDLAKTENLKKLYRIVLTINGEYSFDKKDLSKKINTYLDKYIELFKDDDVISSFFETIDYIKSAIKKEHEEYKDMFYLDDINPKDEFEDKIYDLENMFNNFKYKYGFSPKPIELTDIERIANRRRQTEIKLPKKIYNKLQNKNNK